MRDFYVKGLAALHVAAGLQLEPYERGVRGLHFHRDDPQTSKTCPGRKVVKAELIKLVQAEMDRMTGGDHESDPAVPAVEPPKVDTFGTVNQDDLSVRGGAGAKNAVLRTLNKGARVQVFGSAMNGETKWLNIGNDEWVAARFVTVS